MVFSGGVTKSARITRRTPVGIAVVVALSTAISGCGTVGKWGSNLPEGALAVSLSEGLHVEKAEVSPGTEYSLRFTLRNKKSAPVHLNGIRVRATFGDVKFVDAKVSIRESGDREGRAFKGFPPSLKEADLGTLHDLSTTTVLAHQVVDVVVGVTYKSGDHAGIEGFDVLYEVDGTNEVTAVDAEVEFCRGEMVDRDECADRQIPLKSNVIDVKDEDKVRNPNV